jgi:lysophospholipase
MELVAVARNPVPSGAIVGTFDGHDGKPLRFARWEPTRGRHRGTVCCFTGRSEFIEKYFEVVADLRRRGFAVAIMDWRGQGGSCRPLANPRKAHVSDFSEYDRDLERFMREVVLPDCPPPYIALAHSMGGHILLRQAREPSSWFERMVISAPMLAFHATKMGADPGLVRVYAAAGALVGFGRRYVRGGSDDSSDPIAFENNPLTSDRDRFARNRALIDAAPHLLVGSPTIGWLNAALRSMRMLNDPSYALGVTVPVLIFVAGNDTIVESRAIEDFAARLKLGAHLILPHAKHEILQETDLIRGMFWAAFDAYLGVEAAAA